MLISSPPQVALLETSPYLLALTIIVSIVHSVFEFLAFKNGRHGSWDIKVTAEGSISSLFSLCLGSLTYTLETSWAGGIVTLPGTELREGLGLLPGPRPGWQHQEAGRGTPKPRERETPGLLPVPCLSGSLSMRLPSSRTAHCSVQLQVRKQRLSDWNCWPAAAQFCCGSHSRCSVSF